MKFISMFILMLVFILGMNFYVFYRIWNMIPSGNILRPLLVVFAVIAVSSFFVSILAGGFLPISVTSFLYKLGTSWFFIAIYLLIIFLVLDIVRLTHLLPLDRFMNQSWLGLGAVTLLITAIMTSGYIHYNNKARVDLPLSVNKELKSGSPLKIVAVSDLHLGYSIGKKELEKWIDLINKEKPDIVLMAGDISDNNTKPLFEKDMASSFKKINSRYGIYASVGNHEYIGDLPKTLEFLKQAGVHVLRDSVALIDDSFYIVGRDDRSNPDRKSIVALTGSLDHNKPIIMLDHQPYDLNKVEEAKVDLQISGHTHRGQVWPVSWITDGMYEISHGHLQKGDSHIYVSSGIGIWGGKFRIGTQSEYVVISLSGK